jgi:hypothetical protein
MHHWVLLPSAVDLGLRSNLDVLEVELSTMDPVGVEDLLAILH